MLLGLVYLIAWVDPTLVQWAGASYLFALLLFEFIIIHSSSFILAMASGRATPGYRAASLLAIAAGFAVLVAVVARHYDAWWMLGAFAVLTMNKLVAFFLVPAAAASRAYAWSSWLCALLLYVGCLIASAVVPVPELGAALLDQESFAGAERWTTEPQRYLLWGFAYFTLLALSELTEFAWLDRTVHRVASWIQPGW